MIKRNKLLGPQETNERLTTKGGYNRKKNTLHHLTMMIISWLGKAKGYYILYYLSLVQNVVYILLETPISTYIPPALFWNIYLMNVWTIVALSENVNVHPF